MPNKQLTSYIFLAALTDNGRDLFKTVYVPICKRALSSYSKKGKEFGTDTDIQEEIGNLYGLKVPILVVRELIRYVDKSMSRRDKQSNGLKVFENGKSFQIILYEFKRYEELFDNLSRGADLLQQGFAAYYCECSEDEIANEDIPSFTDFIDHNKDKLAHFFAGKEFNKNDIDKSYLVHVQFIQHVEIHNRYLYELIENTYFGSIIAGYLESGVDLDVKFKNGEEYFIDTQLILRALDLQEQDEALPAKELIELIHNLSGKAKILGITFGEIQYILDTAIENYNNKHPTTTVNQACLRRSKSKTWLINLNSRLQDILIEELGLEFETIPKSKVEKYRKSQDLKDLQKTRLKANAEHDVLAYLHVREKRNTLIRTFQKAKYWFVTGNKNLYHFNLSKNSNGVIGEIILPDALTNLLWLKGDNRYDKEIRKVGLGELLIQTFHEEIASRELINELHAATKEHTDISDEDYKMLLESVAHQSAKKIQKTLALLDDNKEKFNEKVHQIISKERERRKAEGKAKREALDRLHSEKSDKDKAQESLKNIDKALQATNLELNKIKADISEKDRSIEKLKRQQSRLIVSILILIISSVIYLIGVLGFKNLNGAKQIITWISGAGGFWGFLALILALIKVLNDRR